ncbi:MAG: hypothetical protein ACRDRH_01385 [Pseudonocardia sp.]
MSIRTWVVEQLRKDSRAVGAIGEHGVQVLRAGRPDAVAYCVEPDTVNPFTAEALQDAVDELPQVGMVIVTRRVVDPEVYERARKLEVCVDTLGGFTRALMGFDDISQYIHPEESYVRRRMAATKAVMSVTRRGHRAWELGRINGLRPLTIVTHDRYELTDDGFRTEILSQYSNLDLDALVITNSSAQGFGDRVVKSAQQAGVPLYTLNDFIDEIRKPWT